MSWTLCTSGAAIAQAGTNANSSVIASGTLLAEFSNQAEGFVCMETHNDFITNYSTYNSAIQKAVSSCTASIIAMDIIATNPTGYLTAEADMLMNKNYDKYVQLIKYLSDKSKLTLN